MTYASCALKDGGSLSALAVEVVQHCLKLREIYGMWPNGFSEREDTPQLMTGLAGIGHCLLQIGQLSKAPWMLHIGIEPERTSRSEVVNAPCVF